MCTGFSGSLVDEVFGAENVCSVITVVKTAGQSSGLLANVCDYLLWYAKNETAVRFVQPYREKEMGEDAFSHYGWGLFPTGEKRGLRKAEKVGDLT